MTITHKLTLDLQHKGKMPRIDVVQGDAFTRQVDLVLENDGKPWLFPICDPVARYCKPDGTMGVYDTLPTGAPAFSYAGNMLTLVLAPQMLTCPGVVQVQVEMNDQELKLATFTFLVVVEPGVALYGESEDYVNWTKIFLPQTTGAKVGQFQQISKVDDAGRITEMAPAENPAVEATNKAYEALRIANDVAQEMNAYSPSGTRSIAESAMRTASSRLVAPPSASVGQYFRVAAVDANGVVTAVEAVDAPKGGDTVTDEQITQAVSDYMAENPVEGGKGEPGEPGADGKDGFSPTVTVGQTENGAVITITDKNGTTTATVANGKDGADGQDGHTPMKGVDYFDGKDAFNPLADKIAVFDGDSICAAGTDKPDLLGAYAGRIGSNNGMTGHNYAVGGGTITDGKMLLGSNFAGGELGHTVIVMDGAQCTCGRKGCWEAYASATALIRQTKEKMLANKDSKMWQLVNGNIDCTSGRTAFDAMRLGDETAKEVCDNYIYYISVGVNNIINTFQPEIVCIGGGISHEGETLLAPIRKHAENDRYSIHAEKQTKIVAAELGNDAGIFGAALLDE